MLKRYQIMLNDWLVEYLDNHDMPRSKAMRYLIFKAILSKQKPQNNQYDQTEFVTRKRIEEIMK